MANHEETILVTGASGFIGLHCVLRALEAGYRVRGTVRSQGSAESVTATAEKHGAVRERLELVQADLARDDGWPEATAGCRFVLHVASPLPRKPPKRDDDLIIPARDGALRVLGAAADAGVERVVMTSSIAAVVCGHKRDGSETYDETYWSDLSQPMGAYEKSKTIAERAAWDFVKALPADKRIEFATINPGLVLGPILNPDWGTSGEVVRRLLVGAVPGIPDLGWAMVDVRDVADAHLKAMTTPEADGMRFICAGQYATMLDVAAMLAKHYGDRGYRVPTRPVPSWLLRVVALFDKGIRLIIPELGKRTDVDTSRIRTVLNWKARPLEEMVLALGDSMIEYGVV